jgi:NTE family protein
MLPPHTFNPFPIICGTSAGAINTLSLIGRPGTFAQRVASLETMWLGLSAERIYRTDFWGVTKNSLNLLLSLFKSRHGLKKPLALLDNSPLRSLLNNYVQFRLIDEAIASHHLQAIGLTAMSYSTGQSITFFQGNHENWRRARRQGIKTGLTIDHLMASAAIPTLFPPVKIGDRYFGDGALRQLKPLSPALHLGAKRLFVVGVSDNAGRQRYTPDAFRSPSLAQMISHMLNSAFIDTIESDLETMGAINEIMTALDNNAVDIPGLNFHPIDHLCITPSEPLNTLADQYIHELPRSVRMFLTATGANSRGGGSSAASYLLFEPGYCSYLIDLGYRDTLKEEQEISRFFNLDGTDSKEIEQTA